MSKSPNFTIVILHPCSAKMEEIVFACKHPEIVPSLLKAYVHGETEIECSHHEDRNIMLDTALSGSGTFDINAYRIPNNKDMSLDIVIDNEVKISWGHEQKLCTSLKYGTIHSLEIQNILAYLIVNAVSSSSKFARSFYNNIAQSAAAQYSTYVKPCDGFKKHCLFSQLIVIRLQRNYKEILDYKWSYRMNRLVGNRATLDDAMNWLNTLGGGYSALGDHFTHHAESAGNIALKQWKVAVELGDPLILIRCHLYYALSLMQRGYLDRALRIIWTSYRNATHLPVADPRLEAMCKGIWSKLQFYYQKHGRTYLAELDDTKKIEYYC